MVQKEGVLTPKMTHFECFLEGSKSHIYSVIRALIQKLFWTSKYQVSTEYDLLGGPQTRNLAYTRLNGVRKWV